MARSARLEEAMKEDVLRLDDVSKSYGGTTVLEGVSLRVGTGERLVALGPSGCGKTTILRLVAGFVAPDSGRILVNGRAVSENGRVLAPPERRGLGMVFQDLALWPHMTVSGNIEFGLKARGTPRSERAKRAADALALVDMSGYGARKPSELSGGQRQRVALARALVLEPALLLMDEPLSSLDSDLKRRLTDEILSLHGKLGFAMVYVTHDRDEAARLASRVVVMERGRVEFDGTPDNAFSGR